MTCGTTRSTAESEELSGYRVLVVEDDYLVAQEVSETLRERGARVIGPVPDLARARALAAAHTIDCALLDVNLKGQLVFDLAYELLDRGVRLIFTTGYDASFLPADLQDEVCLLKPVDSEDLVRKLRMAQPLSAAPDAIHATE